VVVAVVVIMVDQIQEVLVQVAAVLDIS